MTQTHFQSRKVRHFQVRRSGILFLLTVLFVMLLSFSAFAKPAKRYTPAQAADWIRQLEGQTINYWYPPSNAQCTELVYHYYRHLGANGPGVDAWRYADVKAPAGWVKIPYYSGFVAQEGDIAVWRGGPTGHVALIVSADTASFVSLDQNMGGVHSAHLYRHFYGREGEIWFWGVIRPNFRGGRKDPHARKTGKKLRSPVYHYEGNDRNLVINWCSVWYRGNSMGGRFRIYWNEELLSPGDYKVRYQHNWSKQTMTCTIRGKGIYSNCRGKITVPVS